MRMIQEFTSLEHSLFDYINPELQGIMFFADIGLVGGGSTAE